MKITKQSIPRIATVLWVMGAVLSGLLCSSPPGRVPFFVGLIILAVFPMIYGSFGYRIFCAVALALSLWLLLSECKAAIDIKRHRAETLERIRQSHAMNAPATNSFTP